MALGSRATWVGRMASCASCAPLARVLYIGGSAGRYSAPKRCVTNSRASVCASGETFVLSVRM